MVLLPGDMVWLKNEVTEPGTIGKLKMNWLGPYQVIECRGELVYIIENLNNRDDRRKVNLARLKCCVLDENSIREYGLSGNIVKGTKCDNFKGVVAYDNVRFLKPDPNVKSNTKSSSVKNATSIDSDDSSDDSDSDSDTDSNDSDGLEYEIDAILAHRGKPPNRQFLVHFTGYSNRHNRWTPESDIHADELLHKYKRSKGIR